MASPVAIVVTYPFPRNNGTKPLGVPSRNAPLSPSIEVAVGDMGGTW